MRNCIGKTTRSIIPTWHQTRFKLSSVQRNQTSRTWLQWLKLPSTAFPGYFNLRINRAFVVQPLFVIPWHSGWLWRDKTFFGYGNIKKTFFNCNINHFLIYLPCKLLFCLRFLISIVKSFKFLINLFHSNKQLSNFEISFDKKIYNKKFFL